MFSRVSSRCVSQLSKQFQRSLATVSLKENLLWPKYSSEVSTNGELPSVGDYMPDFTGCVATDLSEAEFYTFLNCKKILNIYPSVDTPVGAKSVAEFNEKVAEVSDAAVLCISGDLPFALSRACESYANVTALSSYRNDYPAKIGIKIEDGPLAGLAARALVVLNGNNRVLYSELVPEISQEPDYDAALKVLADSHVFI